MSNLMEVLANREFVAIVNDRPYMLKGEEIPIVSLVKIIEYGFQRIVNDKCGGADRSADEKDRIATSVIYRILDGLIAARRVGAASVDPMDKWRDRAALALIKTHAPQLIAGLKGEERADKIDAFAAKNEALVEKTAQELMAADRALRDSMATIVVDVNL
jgi:hypothetical protein